METEPLAFRVVRGGLFVAASSYFNIGFGFLANLVLTRLLAPEAFGTFALAMFFAQLLRLQPKLGLGYAFAQHKETTGEAAGTYALLDSGAAVVGLLLSALAAPVLGLLGYSASVAMVGMALAAAAMMEGIGGIGGVLLEKELHFGPASLVQSVAFPLSYIPAFWLATHGGGVWSLVAQNVTYNVLSLVGIAWMTRRRLPHLWQMRWQFSPLLARRFLRFGITVGVGTLAAMLLTQLDNFFIGTFVGVTVLGFYDRAYRIAQWPSLLFNAVLARTAFYTYARLQEDRERLQKMVTMVLWLISMVALPLALVLFITAPDLIVLLYGERWLPSALFLRILVVVSVIRPVWENAEALFVALGKPRLRAIMEVIQVFILALTGIPLTMIWGAVGTCVAVGLAFAGGLALAYRNTAKEVRIAWEELGMPVLISVLIVVGYVALNRVTELATWLLLPRIAIKTLFVILLFAVLIAVTRPRATRSRWKYLLRLASRAGSE